MNNPNKIGVFSGRTVNVKGTKCKPYGLSTTPEFSNRNLCFPPIQLVYERVLFIIPQKIRSTPYHKPL